YPSATLFRSQPERNEPRKRALRLPVDTLQQPDHRLVHLSAVLHDLCDRRAGDVAALVATVPLAGLLVVGVEQVQVGLLEWPVARQMLHQHEQLEAPARVREMPLR